MTTQMKTGGMLLNIRYVQYKQLFLKCNFNSDELQQCIIKNLWLAIATLGHTCL